MLSLTPLRECLACVWRLWHDEDRTRTESQTTGSNFSILLLHGQALKSLTLGLPSGDAGNHTPQAGVRSEERSPVCPDGCPARSCCLVSYVGGVWKEVSLILHSSRLPLPWGTSSTLEHQTGAPKTIPVREGPGRRRAVGMGGVPSCPSVIYRASPLGKHCSARLPKVSASVL